MMGSNPIDRQLRFVSAPSQAPIQEPKGYILAFQDRLGWAFQHLGKSLDAKTLGTMAEKLCHCMTGAYRSFHTPDHVLQVIEGGDPIEVLAALFHDVVYIQVDTCIPSVLLGNLRPFIQDGPWVDGNPVQVRGFDELAQNAPFQLVSSIFEVRQPSDLPRQQNEFLSALVAVTDLEIFFPPAILAQVVACIEATIPFRMCMQDGHSPSDRLYHNLIRANHDFNLELTPEDVVDAIKRAVRLANRDVKNFADVKASYFLDNTWKLLPETNPALRNPECYTPLQYRCALQKMVGLMDFLEPSLVFRQFRGEPSPQEYQGMLDRAAKNIEVARLYLKSKLLALAFVEALHHPERHHTPLINLVGQSRITPAATIASIPTPANPGNTSQAIIEKEVMQLLEVGRNQETTFDIRHSPLAALLARTYGFPQIGQWFDAAQAFFNDQLSAPEFLAIPLPEAVTTCMHHLQQSS